MSDVHWVWRPDLLDRLQANLAVMHNTALFQ
jgi:hypothetical protein